LPVARSIIGICDTRLAFALYHGESQAPLRDRRVGFRLASFAAVFGTIARALMLSKHVHRMTFVHLRRLNKSFRGQTVLDHLDLTVDSGSYLVLLGPSGCGKTTTLRMIAGLETPDSGQVVMNEVDVTQLPPRKRDVSMVFQNDGLYPHLNIGQTIRLALRGRCRSSEIETRCSHAVSMTGIGKLLNKLPAQMSGGELRRAAIAVAVAKRTAVRLLDEPMSALDVAVRQQLQRDVMQWHHEVPGTTVHVTHDGLEAMRVADQIAVMHAGRIIQIGDPATVYGQPQAIAVAEALGTPTMNWMAAELVDGCLGMESPELKCSGTLNVNARSGSVLVGVRPNAFLWGDARKRHLDRPGIDLRSKVQDCRVVQDTVEIRVRAGGEPLTVVLDRGAKCQIPPVGEILPLLVPADQIHVFSCLTQQRVNVCDVA
jgi:ABC-type sugar transport system ATPase subunit